MAKSKSGGTRSYIRGRVGADVYSIGKDAKGAKQQVVRSLAETVSNPQTISQMMGRMIMSTVMQAVSAMAKIVDHSFDNVPKGQPSISEFISRNYALIKADIAAHPASDGKFSINEYLEKGIKPGAYVVAAGDQILPTALSFTDDIGWTIELEGTTGTVGALKSLLGFGDDDYFTILGIKENNNFYFVRFQIDPSLSDDTVIAAGNVGTLFKQEGNISVTPSFADDTITIGNSAIIKQGAVIVSRYVNGAYKHNNATLADPTGTLEFADEAITSYPVGQEAFLNGGDL